MTTVGKKPKSYQLQRSETFPKIRKSLLTLQANSRRSKSCPCLKANKAELTDAELTDDQTTIAQHTKQTIVTKILLDICLRSATIITLCAIFAHNVIEVRLVQSKALFYHIKRTLPLTKFQILNSFGPFFKAGYKTIVNGKANFQINVHQKVDLVRIFF